MGYLYVTAMEKLILRSDVHIKFKTYANICKFLETANCEEVRLKWTHKYYTQVNSQMTITGRQKCYFVVKTNRFTGIIELNY